MKGLFSYGCISGIASALPKERQSMVNFESLYGEKQVARIRKVTGIDEIRVAPLNLTTSDYCAKAAEKLFDMGVSKPTSIDGVVFVSQTPDFKIPHTSATLQHRLGIPRRAIAMDLNFGCPGYVYGLFQAMLLIETGYCKNVLLCAGDTICRHIHPMDKALRMVMGDAGTATIITATDVIRPSAFSFFTDGEGANLLQIPAGGSRMPCQKGKTDIAMTDEDGNTRTMENLFMDGTAILTFALQRVPEIVTDVLLKIGWSKAEVDLFVLHQANEFMVKYLTKRLQVDKMKVPINVKLVGNTGSASIPVLLTTTYPGQNANLKKVIACGFGTGLACIAGAIDLSKAIICPPIEV